MKLQLHTSLSKFLFSYKEYFPASSKCLLDATGKKNAFLNKKIADIYRNKPHSLYAKDQCCLQFTF